MSEPQKYSIRLSKAAQEFNVSETTIKEFLVRKGFQIDSDSDTKLSIEMYELLVKEYVDGREEKNDDMKLGDPEEKKEKRKRIVRINVKRSVRFSQLEFGEGVVSITYKGECYFYRDPNIRNYEKIIRQLFRKLPEASENVIKESPIGVIISIGTDSFSFNDIDIHKYVKQLEYLSHLDYSNRVEYINHLKHVNRLKERHLSVNTDDISKNKEKEDKPDRKPSQRLSIEVPFSALKFGQGMVSISYKKKRFIHRDPNIRNYDEIIKLIYSEISKVSKNDKGAIASIDTINNLHIWVVIDIETESFSFKDIDINIYINRLKDIFLPKNKKVEPSDKTLSTNKNVTQKPSPALKSMTLVAGNIRFYNGYYLIFQTINGEVDNSVTPYRIDDPNSHEILNLVHKYFEQILEQKRIIVKYDETKILEPSRFDLFQLSNYVRDLKRNLDEKDVWWEEVQNARKRSFRQCSGEPTESVKKRVVKSKNEFLYNLSSLQNEKKLIRVYEINHGKEEDAFIFTISMSNNRCAIVFENASKDASTTTWIFVAKNEDYEPCINLVFDYFSDYTITLKRSSLRSTINPPEKFKAESYAFIYHDDIGQWLKKLNKIIGQTPEPSEIQFVPGLHIPESSDTRTGHGETISTRHIHNQLMSKLYDKLCSERGKDNVGTEIRVGTKRIDTVVKGDDFYDIYEIKTAENPFECVTEALGQLCQYTYLFCRDKIGKMVIVGPSEMTKEVKEYLSWFRKNYSLQLYYMKV